MIGKVGMFFLTLLLAATGSWQDEVSSIDKQIVEMRDLKEKYQASVQRNTNNAMRWQFQRENYLDARRAWDQIAREKQAIQELQDRIDDLETQKQKILKKNGKIGES